MRTRRSHGKDAGSVASVMAQEGPGNGILPGKGTEWGKVDPSPELNEQK